MPTLCCAAQPVLTQYEDVEVNFAEENVMKSVTIYPYILYAIECFLLDYVSAPRAKCKLHTGPFISAQRIRTPK